MKEGKAGLVSGNRLTIFLHNSFPITLSDTIMTFSMASLGATSRNR